MAGNFFFEGESVITRAMSRTKPRVKTWQSESYTQKLLIGSIFKLETTKE